MKVKISKKHIEEAVRGNSRHCMIADAIREQFGDEVKQVIVDAQSIRWTDPVKDLRYTYMTPPEAQAKLIAFDAGKEVQPFTIEIGKPVLIRSTHVDVHGKPRKTPIQQEQISAKTSRQVREGQRELRQRVFRTAKREFGIRAFEQNQEQK